MGFAMKSDVIGLRLVFLVAFAGDIILEGRSTSTNAESESESITPLAASFCEWDFPRRADVYGIHLSPVIMCSSREAYPLPVRMSTEFNLQVWAQSSFREVWTARFMERR